MEWGKMPSKRWHCSCMHIQFPMSDWVSWILFNVISSQYACLGKELQCLSKMHNTRISKIPLYNLYCHSLQYLLTFDRDSLLSQGRNKYCSHFVFIFLQFINRGLCGEIFIQSCREFRKEENNHMSAHEHHIKRKR